MSQGEASRKTKEKANRLVRTSVVLDDDLTREAMALTGTKTKRKPIDEALRTLVRLRKQEGIWELFGTIDWEGDLDEMRRSRFPDWDR